MAKSLNYGAVVPAITNGQIHVEASKNPPGDYRYKDFVAKDSSLVASGRTRRANKNYIRRPVARYEQDYIDPVLSADKRKREKEDIIAIAKQMYSDDARKREQYVVAQKRVAEATDEERDNPSRDLHRSMRMLEVYKPLSKQAAMQKAAEQFYSVSTRS